MTTSAAENVKMGLGFLPMNADDNAIYCSKTRIVVSKIFCCVERQ